MDDLPAFARSTSRWTIDTEESVYVRRFAAWFCHHKATTAAIAKSEPSGVTALGAACLHCGLVLMWGRRP
jgi:hypothetical protein